MEERNWSRIPAIGLLALFLSLPSLAVGEPRQSLPEPAQRSCSAGCASPASETDSTRVAAETTVSEENADPGLVGPGLPEEVGETGPLLAPSDTGLDA